MKKFKLNAALASALSLGVVCSSFAYASEIEDPEIYAGFSTSRRSGFKESKAENIEKEFKGYKENRGYLVYRIENLKEKVDDEELNGLASNLTNVLCEVLKELNSLSKHWSPEIKESFRGHGWENIPKVDYIFILRAKNERMCLSFEDNECTCLSLKDNLNDLCEFVKSLPEKFESEKILFPILSEIFYESRQISKIFTENNKLRKKTVIFNLH